MNQRLSLKSVGLHTLKCFFLFPMTLHLHIDQIFLEGVDIPRSQRPQLQAALEEELSRLLTTQDISPAMQTERYIPRLPANLTITGKPNPIQLGQQLAQSIYAQLQAGYSNNNP